MIKRECKIKCKIKGNWASRLKMIAAHVLYIKSQTGCRWASKIVYRGESFPVSLWPVKIYSRFIQKIVCGFSNSSRKKVTYFPNFSRWFLPPFTSREYTKKYLSWQNFFDFRWCWQNQSFHDSTPEAFEHKVETEWQSCPAAWQQLLAGSFDRKGRRLIWKIQLLDFFLSCWNRKGRSLVALFSRSAS